MAVPVVSENSFPGPTSLAFSSLSSRQRQTRWGADPVEQVGTRSLGEPPPPHCFSPSGGVLQGEGRRCVLGSRPIPSQGTRTAARLGAGAL